MECVKKLKASFASVGAFSSEENFTRGNPKGPIEWINHESEAFEEILNSRGEICAFSGVSHPVLEGKPNANHVRARISYSRTQQLHNMDIITQCSK
jgi:hypothetical protein